MEFKWLVFDSPLVRRWLTNILFMCTVDFIQKWVQDFLACSFSYLNTVVHAFFSLMLQVHLSSEWKACRVLKPTLLKLQLMCAAVVHSSITHSRLVFLLGDIVAPIAPHSTQREMLHPHNIHNTCFILLYDFHPHWILSNTRLLNEVSAKPESSSFHSRLS